MGRILLLTCLLLVSCPALATEVSADELLHEIQAAGARTVVERYFGSPEWRLILEGVGTADEQLLAVYSGLRTVADGEAGEDLSAAIWDVALLSAPYKVMSLEGYDSCDFSFEDKCPAEGIKNYLDRLEQGLRLAKTNEQKRMRRHCLAGIKKTRKRFPDPQAYCAG